MSRIIINIEDNIPQSQALQYVWNVISQGRISEEGKSYCFVTKFQDGTVVLADKKKADIFYVRKDVTNDIQSKTRKTNM